ncbi:MAG: tetratricopeptide repeat protein [Candidatus Coatesbacteria bacterium]|nr:MAG: tetratricopeptide repeat protein [Candidatus Coatesbacteria bacterium]
MGFKDIKQTAKIGGRKAKHPVNAEIEPVYEKALALIDSGEHEKARRVLMGLVELYPDEPRLLNSIGATYFQEEGDAVEAERYFREALKRAPDLSPALANLSSLFGSLERFDEAAEYARRAIKYNPESAIPWMNLGLYYVRLGDLKSGLEYFLAAYSFDDGYLPAAYNAACALTELGRTDEALEYLKKAAVKKRLREGALDDPVLAPLRESQEFKEIIAAIGEGRE